MSQVQFIEPVPPRRLQPGVPRDLETISLKCLRKEPGQRYPTAEALADDLRRFLAGEPIQSRPAGLIERAAKWGRRRPAAAALLGGSVLSALVFFLWGWHYVTQLQEYNSRLKTERQRADDQSRLALDTIKPLVLEVQADLKDAPGMQELRLKLLQTALDGLERLVSGPRDAGGANTTAEALVRLGHIHLEKSDPRSACQVFQFARDIAEGLMHADPANQVAQVTLAEAYRGLGVGTARQGKVEDGRLLLLKGLGVAESLAAAGNPDARESVLNLCNELGDVYAELGKRSASRDSYLKAVAIGQPLASVKQRVFARRELGYAYATLGHNLTRWGKPAKGRGPLEEALRLRDAMVREKDSSWSRVDRGETHYLLGMCLRLLGEDKGARDNLNEAIRRLMAEAKANPGHTRVQRFLAIAYSNAARASLEWEDMAAVWEYGELSQAVCEKVAGAHPDDMLLQRELIECYFRLGWLKQAALRPLGAVTWYERAAALLRRLIEEGKLTRPSHRTRLKGLEQAAEECRALAKELEGLKGQHARSPDGGQAPSVPRAAALACLGRHAEVAAIGRLLEAAAEGAQGRYDAGRCYALARAAVAPGGARGRFTPDEEEARGNYARQAVAALKRAVERGDADLSRLDEDPYMARIRLHKECCEWVNGLSSRM